MSGDDSAELNQLRISHTYLAAELKRLRTTIQLCCGADSESDPVQVLAARLDELLRERDDARKLVVQLWEHIEWLQEKPEPPGRPGYNTGYQEHSWARYDKEMARHARREPPLPTQIRTLVQKMKLDLERSNHG